MLSGVRDFRDSHFCFSCWTQLRSVMLSDFICSSMGRSVGTAGSGDEPPHGLVFHESLPLLLLAERSDLAMFCIIWCGWGIPALEGPDGLVAAVGLVPCEVAAECTPGGWVERRPLGIDEGCWGLLGG